MVPEQYKIQYSAIFVIFLSWLLANIFGLFTSFRTTKAQDGEANDSAPETSSNFHTRVTDIGHILKDGLYLLSISLILNTYMSGNRTSIDTFSLIAMFSIILASVGELIGMKLVTKGFWILFLISIFSIFVTAFATPGYFFNFSSLTNPSGNGVTGFGTGTGTGFGSSFNPNDFWPRNG